MGGQARRFLWESFLGRFDWLTYPCRFHRHVWPITGINPRSEFGAISRFSCFRGIGQRIHVADRSAKLRRGRMKRAVDLLQALLLCMTQHGMDRRCVQNTVQRIDSAGKSYHICDLGAGSIKSKSTHKQEHGTYRRNKMEYVRTVK